MESSTTTELQPSELSEEIHPELLSEEVQQELVTDTGIEQEKAEQFAEQIRLNELVTKQPNTESYSSIFRTKIGQTYNLLRNTLSQKTRYATVEDIYPTETDQVAIEITHPEYSRTLTAKVHPQSPQLSNLMEYHNVDNPTKLINKQILISNVNKRIPTQLNIPKNVSIIGKYKYKVLSSLKNIAVLVPNYLKNYTYLPAFLSMMFVFFGTLISSSALQTLGSEGFANLSLTLQTLVLSPFIFSIIFTCVSIMYYTSSSLVSRVDGDYYEVTLF